MRYPIRAAVVLLLLMLVFGAHASLDDPVADCPYSVDRFRSPREIWHDASVRAERVAPTLAAADAASSGRHRASAPPKPGLTPKNFIDVEIFGKMQRDGIVPTVLASDEEFLRRVTLDLTGEIPEAETVRAFLADRDPNKRERMIDRLLASPAFVDKWTMWFGDHVQNVQVAANTVLYYQGRNAYHKSIRDSIESGKPYDQMVRELIAGSGKSFTDGAANFWVRQWQNNGPIQDTYDNLSAFTGEKFLGLPLNCLSCHSGPGHLELVNASLAKRTRMEFWQNAAFFAQSSGTSARDPNSNSREWTITENPSGAYRLNTVSGNKTPRQPAPGAPNFVDPAFFLDGERPKSGETRRGAYGRILTAHPQFARATVNYLWKEVFGVGIVEPADSFDLNRQDPSTLPPGTVVQPTHPQLLSQLADAFRASNFNLRALLKTIVMSNAYQLSSRYTVGPWNESMAPYYARHYPRRLMAEEIADAIIRATGVTATFTYQGAPAPVAKAMMLPDPTERGGSFANFLSAFGRGDRDDTMRTNDSSIVQALMLMNDRVVTDRIRATNASSTVGKLTRATRDPGEIADGLYLATLSRYPTAAERAAAIEHLRSGDLSRKAEDLQFALLNKLEFFFN